MEEATRVSARKASQQERCGHPNFSREPTEAERSVAPRPDNTSRNTSSHPLLLSVLMQPNNPLVQHQRVSSECDNVIDSLLPVKQEPVEESEPQAPTSILKEMLFGDVSKYGTESDKENSRDAKEESRCSNLQSLLLKGTPAGPGFTTHSRDDDCSRQDLRGHSSAKPGCNPHQPLLLGLLGHGTANVNGTSKGSDDLHSNAASRTQAPHSAPDDPEDLDWLAHSHSCIIEPDLERTGSFRKQVRSLYPDTEDPPPSSASESHPALGSPKSKSKLKCNRCDRQFFYPASYSKHMANKHGEHVSLDDQQTKTSPGYKHYKDLKGETQATNKTSSPFLLSLLNQESIQSQNRDDEKAKQSDVTAKGDTAESSEPDGASKLRSILSSSVSEKVAAWQDYVKTNTCHICGRHFQYLAFYKRHMASHAKNGHFQPVKKKPSKRRTKRKNVSKSTKAKSESSENLDDEKEEKDPITSSFQVNTSETQENNKSKYFTYYEEQNSGCDESDHSVDPDEDKHTAYLCNICGKAFSSAHHLSEHQTTHSSSEGHKCEKCHKEFPTKEDVEIHFENCGSTEKAFYSRKRKWMEEYLRGQEKETSDTSHSDVDVLNVKEEPRYDLARSCEGDGDRQSALIEVDNAETGETYLHGSSGDDRNFAEGGNSGYQFPVSPFTVRVKEEPEDVYGSPCHQHHHDHQPLYENNGSSSNSASLWQPVIGGGYWTRAESDAKDGSDSGNAQQTVDEEGHLNSTAKRPALERSQRGRTCDTYGGELPPTGGEDETDQNPPPTKCQLLRHLLHKTPTNENGHSLFSNHVTSSTHALSSGPSTRLDDNGATPRPQDGRIIIKDEPVDVEDGGGEETQPDSTSQQPHSSLLHNHLIGTSAASAHFNNNRCLQHDSGNPGGSRFDFEFPCVEADSEEEEEAMESDESELDVGGRGGEDSDDPDWTLSDMDDDTQGTSGSDKAVGVSAKTQPTLLQKMLDSSVKSVPVWPKNNYNSSSTERGTDRTRESGIFTKLKPLSRSDIEGVNGDRVKTDNVDLASAKSNGVTDGLKASGNSPLLLQMLSQPGVPSPRRPHRITDHSRLQSSVRDRRKPEARREEPAKLAVNGNQPNNPQTVTSQSMLFLELTKPLVASSSSFHP